MAGLRDAVPGGLPPTISDRTRATSLTPPTEIMRKRMERQRLRDEEAARLLEQQREKDEQARQREPQEPSLSRRQPPGPESGGGGGGGGEPNRNSRGALDAIPPGDRRRNPQPTQSNRASHERHQSDVPTTQRPPRTDRAGRERTNTNPLPSAASTTQPSKPSESRAKPTSSFPHAFERWETLSSHWEGLTGYWIKRLQNNSDELSGQPLNQQLARQVTDLSAAGANLFHAVVELQRLRASSERKFQRWFFETRADQEKQTEEIAKLKTQLREGRSEPREQPVGISREVQDRYERQLRDQQELFSQQLHAADEKIRQTNDSTQQQMKHTKAEAEKQLVEMRRELQISRDEARRSWEEIGRMEQSERDRMYSLRRGEPTLVGNIQVVPMMARPAASSRPTTREGALSSHPVQPEDMQYANYGDARSEADTDPFTESGGQKTSSNVASRIAPLMPQSQPQTTYPTSAAAVEASTRAVSASPGRPGASAGTASPRSQPSTTHAAYPPRSESYSAPRPGPTSAPGSAGFYQQQQPVLHQQPGQAQPTVLQADETKSYGTVSDDGYDMAGNPTRDPSTRSTAYQQERMRSPSDVSDDYGTAVPPGSGYPYTTSNGNNHGVAAPDYSGAGYGRDEWGTIINRHHHPTRLSDIVEENSRTSPSRASERSHGFR